jgi:nucleoside-diphosphate-sugar epimerase
MRKVLVTGSTGFIGGHVINRLLSEGCRVIATSAHEERARLTPWFERVQYVAFDLANTDAAVNYYHFFGEPDSLIHLAWEGLPNYKSSFHLEVNYPRHAAFLENMVRNGLRDITVTGTCLEYGMQEGCLREDLPAMPGNPYALAKDALRQSLEPLEWEYGFGIKWVRLFYMYGPGQNPNSLLSQLDRALAAGEPVFNMSGGEQVRDYLPVEKMADCIADIALQNEITGIVNACSGQPITVRQLVNNHLAATGGQITLNLGYYPYTDYEPMRFWGDVKKLRTIQSNNTFSQ